MVRKIKNKTFLILGIFGLSIINLFQNLISSDKETLSASDIDNFLTTSSAHADVAPSPAGPVVSPGPGPGPGPDAGSGPAPDCPAPDPGCE